MNQNDIIMLQEFLVDRIILSFAQKKINSLNNPCPQGALCPLDRGREIFIVFWITKYVFLKVHDEIFQMR